MKKTWQNFIYSPKIYGTLFVMSNFTHTHTHKKKGQTSTINHIFEYSIVH